MSKRLIDLGHLIGWLLICPLLMFSQAQVATTVTPDGTLPQNTIVTPNGSGVDIEGGTPLGANLFHSFSDFNVGTGDTVRFMPPDITENILSRVTGGQMSMIDGRLESTQSDANLYLINPNGVMFGANSSLDVRGSFHVSTANEIQLSDDGHFSADPRPEMSQLTIAAPAAFGFLRSEIAPIEIRGVLDVPESEALSVVGGDIRINRGRLEAPGGWINLVSTASAVDIPLLDGVRIGPIPSWQGGEITMQSGSRVAILGVDGGVFIRGGQLRAEGQASINSTAIGLDGQGGNIDIGVDQLYLSDGASISTNTLSRSQGGRIVINANEMTITDNAFMMSDTFPLGGDLDGNGGAIEVNINESLVIDGRATISSLTRGTGHAGTINIRVGERLAIQGDTTISSSTFGAGNAGTVSLFSDGIAELDQATITVSGAQGSTGQAGSIFLEADTLQLRGASQITAEARGEGDAGLILVRATAAIEMTDRSTISSSTFGAGAADQVSLIAPTITIDSSSIAANTGLDSSGSAGDIVLTGETLVLENNTQITAAAQGTGAGGDIQINAADRMTMRGGSTITTSAVKSDGGLIRIEAGSWVEVQASEIEASVSGGNGRGGDINVHGGMVYLQDGTRIASSTGGAGAGGAVTVSAEQMLVVDSHSAVTSNTRGAGNGGRVTVEADVVYLSDGASLNSVTFGGGRGGEVTVRARMAMIEDQAFIRSDTFGQGHGGRINFEVEHLMANGQALVASSSFGQLATGNAGSVSVQGMEGGRADQVTITDSMIITSSDRANGGNIEIRARQMIRLNNSTLTAEGLGDATTTGGDITLDADAVVLQSSSVVTNTEEAEAADINIPGRVFIADSKSVLRASGQVFNSSEVLETGGLIQLLLTFSQSKTLQNHPCADATNRDQSSSFALVGREALPLEPGNVLLSDLSLEGLEEGPEPPRGLREPLTLPIIIPSIACSQ